MSNLGFEPFSTPQSEGDQNANDGGDGVVEEVSTVAKKRLIPFWINSEDPLLWDTVELGNIKFPGLAVVTGSGLRRKVDVKKPKGSDGASLRDEGYQPAEIGIELLIYNRFFWEQLQNVMSLINPRKKGGIRQPLTISHPLTELLGITRIYVKEIPVPVFDKRNGFMTVALKAIEWFPAPKPVKRGKAAGTKGSNKEDEPDVGDKQSLNSFQNTQASRAKKGGMKNVANLALLAVCNNFPDAIPECATL